MELCKHEGPLGFEELRDFRIGKGGAGTEIGSRDRDSASRLALALHHIDRRSVAHHAIAWLERRMPLNARKTLATYATIA